MMDIYIAFLEIYSLIFFLCHFYLVIFCHTFIFLIWTVSLQSFFQIRYRDVIESKFIFSKSRLSIFLLNRCFVSTMSTPNKNISPSERSFVSTPRNFSMRSHFLQQPLKAFISSQRSVDVFFSFEKGLTLGNPVLILGIRFLVAANVLLMANDLRKKWKRFIISKLQIELEYRVSVGFGKIRNSHCAIDCKLNFIGDNFICQLTRY